MHNETARCVSYVISTKEIFLISRQLHEISCNYVYVDFRRKIRKFQVFIYRHSKQRDLYDTLIIFERISRKLFVDTINITFLLLFFLIFSSFFFFLRNKHIS